MVWSGLTAAIFSAFCNGTFGMLGKTPSVKRAKVGYVQSFVLSSAGLVRLTKLRVPSPIFNFWVGIGIVLSSVPVLFFQPLVFSAWGLLSGTFFVVSTANLFFAIERLGLSVATGVSCGTAVLVSFTAGVQLLGDQISNPFLAAPALVLLILGLAGIGLNGQVAKNRRARQKTQFEGDVRGDEPLLGAEAGRPAGAGEGPDAALDENGANESEGFGVVDAVREAAAEVMDAVAPDSPAETQDFLAGLAAAVVTGVFGGLILAPMDLAPEDKQGLRFVPSMAAGVLISVPVVTALLVFFGHRKNAGLHARAASLPGIVSGTLWNLGNMASIIATEDPDVGLSIAYPIMQCGLFIAGLWGIFLFDELRGRETIGYWISGGILILGCVLLYLSK